MGPSNDTAKENLGIAKVLWEIHCKQKQVEE